MDNRTGEGIKPARRIRLRSRVGDDVLVLEDRIWKTNGVAIRTPESVVLVDTFSDPPAALAAHALIRKHFGRSVSLVINTHHHYDHVLGNRAFRGTRILTHANVLDRMHGYESRVLAWIQKNTTLQNFALEFPTELISESTTLDAGGKRMEIIVAAPCHTDNDLCVYVPEDGVLITGDIYVPDTVYPVNFNSGADVAHWRDELRRLASELPADTTVVPGHFDTCALSRLNEQADYLDALLSSTHTSDPDSLFTPYESWLNFEKNHPKNIDVMRGVEQDNRPGGAV